MISFPWWIGGCLRVQARRRTGSWYWLGDFRVGTRKQLSSWNGSGKIFSGDVQAFCVNLHWNLEKKNMQRNKEMNNLGDKRKYRRSNNNSDGSFVQYLVTFVFELHWWAWGWICRAPPRYLQKSTDVYRYPQFLDPDTKPAHGVVVTRTVESTTRRYWLKRNRVSRVVEPSTARFTPPPCTSSSYA